MHTGLHRDRAVAGSAAGAACALVFAAAMVPMRSHLSIATTGLVLVVPVIGGVIIGGYPAGLVSVVVGFLVYDFVFIPPYYTLSVGTAQNWVALAVYVVVMLLVAQVVARLQLARSEAVQRASETQRLFELSELLVDDRPLGELLETVVGAIQTVFEVEGVALLLPLLPPSDGSVPSARAPRSNGARGSDQARGADRSGPSDPSQGKLSVFASAGTEFSPEELSRLAPESRVPVAVGTVGTGRAAPHEVRAVALSAAGRPIGILALKGLAASDADRDILRTFANHAAVAIERAQLRSQALRTELLEEVDRLRRALLGAVSHDLRTPLATMKVASSTLLNPDINLGPGDKEELYGLIDVQTDRLTRLVTSLLDMTRYQAGVLSVDPQPSTVLDLVGECLAAVRPALGERAVTVEIDDTVPPVMTDPVLIGQVLVNLVENADRHAPPGTVLTIGASRAGDKVSVWVRDRGPGIPASGREAVFSDFVRFDRGGRAGLGLAIAQTFVEAHGERIWVEGPADGGARFVFTLPVAGL